MRIFFRILFKMMKKKNIHILFVLLLVSLAWASAVILEFRAEPTPDKTIITWKTGEEIDVTSFWVERSSDDHTYVKIGEVPPKGSNSSYQYFDNSISQVQSVYYYRLEIRNADGTSQFTESLSVIPNVSSIKRTWGSIKALFR